MGRPREADAFHCYDALEQYRTPMKGMIQQIIRLPLTTRNMASTKSVDVL